MRLLVGLLRYTPRLVELTMPRRSIDLFALVGPTSRVVQAAGMHDGSGAAAPNGHLYLQQLPCSWGQLFFPRPCIWGSRPTRDMPIPPSLLQNDSAGRQSLLSDCGSACSRTCRRSTSTLHATGGLSSAPTCTVGCTRGPRRSMPAWTSNPWDPSCPPRQPTIAPYLDTVQVNIAHSACCQGTRWGNGGWGASWKKFLIELAFLRCFTPLHTRAYVARLRAARLAVLCAPLPWAQ